MKLGADTLRDFEPTPTQVASLTKKPIYLIIDNVQDTFNVGSIFRLADAASVSGIYLVGRTATPLDSKIGHKIHKASVGLWRWMPWEHVDTVTGALTRIGEKKDMGEGPWLSSRRAKGAQLQTIATEQQPQGLRLQTIAIEQSPKSVPYNAFDYHMPLALIVGHETTGVSKEGLEVADVAVEIPMYGVNKSLNVMVSLAIVLWHVLGR